jgi:hypothetical protein
MNDLRDDIWNQALQRGLSDDARLVVASVAGQQLELFVRGQSVARYPMATSRYGIGSAKGSHQTPPGWHEITEWIGGHLPLGTVLKSRVPAGEVVPESEWAGQRKEDLILSRILRLSGLEEGVNRGGEVDSFARYIYIHGTNHEHLLGQPSSSGCIRLSNRDVAQLYDQTNDRPTWCWVG